MGNIVAETIYAMFLQQFFVYGALKPNVSEARFFRNIQ